MIDHKNKIDILEATKAMEFENGKMLYHLIVKKEDVEKMNGVRLFQIFRKNVCKIIYDDEE